MTEWGNISNLDHLKGYWNGFVLRTELKGNGQSSDEFLVYFHSDLKKIVSIFDKTNESML